MLPQQQLPPQQQQHLASQLHLLQHGAAPHQRLQPAVVVDGQTRAPPNLNLSPFTSLSNHTQYSHVAPATPPVANLGDDAATSAAAFGHWQQHHHHQRLAEYIGTVSVDALTAQLANTAWSPSVALQQQQQQHMQQMQLFQLQQQLHMQQQQQQQPLQQIQPHHLQPQPMAPPYAGGNAPAGRAPTGAPQQQQQHNVQLQPQLSSGPLYSRQLSAAAVPQSFEHDALGGSGASVAGDALGLLRWTPQPDPLTWSAPPPGQPSSGRWHGSGDAAAAAAPTQPMGPLETATAAAHKARGAHDPLGAGSAFGSLPGLANERVGVSSGGSSGLVSGLLGLGVPSMNGGAPGGMLDDAWGH